MKLIVNKDRSVIPVGTWGTVNENDYEILDFEFPEELDGYNKRIVYYLDDEKVWDAIVDNKAYITNTITTKGDVKAYVWCTKTDSQYETDVDFRTQLFEMNFYENENASGIVPTPEQVDGFNTMLTAMNTKIDEVDALEQTIEAAEAQRQEAEATRVSNENTRESNESTRQTNEQTRQTQEADRERRTDEAIADIEDKTAEYNANAEAKTNAFNQNATQKTNEFNSNYTQKVNDFNTNATTQKTDFNTNASSKTSAFNSNAESKTSTFNTNASDKTSEFNTNAESKTSAFNDNATQKTTNFDNNVSEKTDEFNTNAQDKIDEYDEHIVEYQAQIDELQEEVEELSENMPWTETEQATSIDITDAAKYNKNKMKVFGNTEQASYEGKNLFSGTTYQSNAVIQNNGTINYNTNCNVYQTEVQAETQYTISITSTDDTYNRDCRIVAYTSDGTYIQAITMFTTKKATTSTKTFTTPANTGLIRYHVQKLSKDVQLEEGSTATDYEPYTGGVPSPSPDYPQDIHVVSGENIIEVQGKNLFPSNLVRTDKDWLKVNSDGSISIKYDTGGNINFTNLFKEYLNIPKGKYILKLFVEGTFKGGNLLILNTEHKAVVQNGIFNNAEFYIQNSDIGNMQLYVVSAGTDCTIKFELEEGTTVPTEYHPYYHADYPINLGSLELCKIGSYQDYLYKENGNWYKFGNVGKIIYDGTENWSTRAFSDNNYLSLKRTLEVGENGGYCNNFISNNSYSVVMEHITLNKQWQECAFVILKSRLSTENATGFKNWLSEHNTTVYYILATPTTTQITDETLIAQLNAIYNHLALVKGTNHITITPSDLAPYVTLNYMQDLPSKLDNLDSRLALLE